ncbi:MAG: 6-carboxytetrahydropterin synthase QueD [Deltaproteobacteria bacterium]|nr:6-carboxytetrahydropterin synthase QueD [Deltaproteobacteria bacterium]
MYELKVIARFAAAHQLKMVAKKCENLHGHNWKIEVCLAGKALNSAGVLMDFGQFKNILSEIIKKLDHKFLNDLEYFSDSFPPSSENIANYIANELMASINDPLVRVSSVTAWESENACATYKPPA